MLGVFLLITGFFSALLSQSDKWTSLPGLTQGEIIHYVSGATIYDENLIQLKSFPGMGVFFDDGSYILALNGPKRQIVRYTAYGEVVWERDFYTHHQLNLSNDKKRILVLSGEVRKEGRKKFYYDTFALLDVETGKTLKEKTSFDFFTATSVAFKERELHPDTNHLKTDGAITHFNAFYEIPSNATEKKRPEFKSGNFIVNDVFRRHFFILDPELNLVLEEFPMQDCQSGYHDVQVLADGKIISYCGGHTGEPRRTKVFKYDPLLRTSELIFPEDLKKQGVSPFISYSELWGSVQERDSGYLISHFDFEQGGMIILTDRAGHLLKKMYHPDINPTTGKPAGTQQVKQFELSEFLKNNKM